MFKDLLNPTNINVMVSKLSDILVKQWISLWDMPLIGEGSGLCGQCILKPHAVASSLLLRS